MKTETYKVVEVDKKGKILFKYYDCVEIENARYLKKKKIHHLTESGLIEVTVVILDSNNKIVN